MFELLPDQIGAVRDVLNELSGTCERKLANLL
jgi:hypothetical protein